MYVTTAGVINLSSSSSWKFFTSALANGFPMKLDWQQVSSSLQDSSQYSDRSQQCFCLDSLHPSRYFKVLHFLYQSFGDDTKSTNYNWYKRYFHVPQLCQFPSKVQVLIPLFTFFQFYSVVCRDSKVHNSESSLFFVDYYKIWLSGPDLVICLYLKIPEEFVHLIVLDRFWVVHIPCVRIIKLQFLAQFPVDHLAHPVLPSLIFFLCQFAAFANHVIDRFISFPI